MEVLLVEELLVEGLTVVMVATVVEVLLVEVGLVEVGLVEVELVGVEQVEGIMEVCFLAKVKLSLCFIFFFVGTCYGSKHVLFSKFVLA